VQPKNIESNESLTKRIFQRVSKSIRRIGHEIFKPKPCNSQRTYETAKKCIRRTQKQVKTKGDNVPSMHVPVPQAAPHSLPLFVEPLPYNGPTYNAHRDVNYIPDDESIANVFCFGAFADKVSGVVYNDLTGNFHFMLIDGSVFLCTVPL
jgi:hypothetical protein